MDRREFFKRGLKNVSDTTIKQLDAHAEHRATHWIRPPYAINELEFLLACTRCSECIEACQYKVIFRLPTRLGVQVAGTPALDLLNKGCHLCDDWPCVSVCKPDALMRLQPSSDEGSLSLPTIACASINTRTCLPYMGPECGACDSACPVDGAMIWDDFKPVIIQDMCTGCGLCREACITEPKSIEIHSLHYQSADKVQE